MIVRFQLFHLPAVLTAGAMLLSAGCGEAERPVDRQSATVVQSEPETVSVGEEPSPEPEAREVSLEDLTLAEVENLVSSYQGKVVVVDLWALW